ncbi:NAD(P)-dependent oxidoreductase [cf. Phormidesmis sp. LEGE 11477]|uniref:NAD(P)-dependent oxidoreductase n=1 Tax=cf. Phormidesmis sp. LEGE 11477 TaxID=1828680 RepID=UPI00187E8B01|nr:NAD(P)-dependent oxidoreductase [cf. Phormidesmis sp. LEGE 11477]MBE9061422.1 NAD(P)-dependent oxidoreductase [cf. Phormidesmis sp. LEGE 11477]
MKIGLLGTGLMGAPMALRLQHSGFEVSAWNRTQQKLLPLAKAGIRTVDSAAEAIASTELTITMLSDAAALEAALFRDPAALSGRTLLQMGTIAPSESRELCAKVQAADGDYLESPVLGSIPQVKSGSLILMVGARPEQFDRQLPVLRCFGPSPELMGPVGTAAAAKLAMNQLIGSLTAAFSMSLGFVQKEGLDVEKFMSIVRESALYAPTFDKKLARMCDRNFSNPNFPTKHLLKDMNLFVQAAQAQGIDATVAAGVSQVARNAITQGLADGDYSAIYSAISQRS